MNALKIRPALLKCVCVFTYGKVIPATSIRVVKEEVRLLQYILRVYQRKACRLWARCEHYSGERICISLSFDFFVNLVLQFYHRKKRALLSHLPS